MRRAANRYRDVVRRAGLYGVRQRFDAAVRRSVQRQGPIVYNVYYCKDKVYEETAQVQVHVGTCRGPISYPPG